MRLANTHNPVFKCIFLRSVHLYLLAVKRLYHIKILSLNSIVNQDDKENLSTPLPFFWRQTTNPDPLNK
jgi:hypothetical protein